MSVDRLKKQAKNARPLLEAFAPGTQCTLSQAQTFVAQLNGYPDWHSAVKAQQSTPKPSPNPPQDQPLWYLKYTEVTKDGQCRLNDFRIIRDANDAISSLFLFYDAFCELNDVVGFSDALTLECQPCDETNVLGNEQLVLTSHARNAILHLSLYPMSNRILLLELPYTSEIPHAKEHINKYHATFEMAHMLEAARFPFAAIKEHLESYEKAHPAAAARKRADKIFDDIVREATAKNHSQQQTTDLWDCEVIRIERWRFKLIYHTASQTFYFDVFDEGHNRASFLHPAALSAIKRKPSGQWVACEYKGKAQIALTGVTDVHMDQLRDIAGMWGFGLVVDSMTEVSPQKTQVAPSQTKFLQWLHKQ